MGNVSDLHLGSKASAEKKNKQTNKKQTNKQKKKTKPVNARKCVFLLLQINCTMGVLPLAQTVLSTHVR